ncbi:M14 family zinc carboxypeptidase [Luteococcus sanguinis]|uniref:M14 family zinc carboxypeptidase n=1 Tax=Luteococcus sanguinis TaxID=174038 RepID=A0ABW1X4B8_9ACTN
MRKPTRLAATTAAAALALTAFAGPSAHATTWTTCGGVFGGVDFPNGSITKQTSQLVAVWRKTAYTSQVTTLTRTTAGACTFTSSTRYEATKGYVVPASTATRTVKVRHLTAKNLIERRVLGYSVQGRPIVAYLVGDPKASRTSVLLGQIHGNEKAGHKTAISLVNGPTITGLRLWVIPTANPDGYAAGTRQNAHRVDLNRNFSHNWVKTSTTSKYYGGSKPFSEPESRVLRDFVAQVQPYQIVSIHQPLYGVDGYGLKDATLGQRLATQLGLPQKEFSCTGVCHGTFVGWVNHVQDGTAITVEYAKTPTTHFMTFTARRGITFALRGAYA